MGTPVFAGVSLNTLLRENMDVVAVVTAPDKPAGRGLKMQASPVKTAAKEAGLPVLQPEKLRDPEFISHLQQRKPDIIAVVAFRILPEEVFTIPPLGTINLHGSLLPKYRGAAPINQAIINGETETGVTTFFIKKEVDTGNMIDQVRIPIGPDMTAGELHDIMAVEGAKLLVTTLRKIEQGDVPTSKQDESLVTKAPKIRRDDCMINFNQPAKTVHDFIRGLSPYPAAHTFLNGRMIKLFDSKISEKETTEEHGTILEITSDDSWVISCAEGCITIGEVQMEGKRRMKVGEFVRGYDVEEGKVLGQSPKGKG